MRIKKILPFYVFLLLFCAFLLADAKPDQEQTAAGMVKVIVRFAKIRILPAADAKIIKQIGYGTMFLVLGKSGEYFQVTALNVPPSSVKPVWYILQSEVEAASTQPLRPRQENRLVTFEPPRPVAGQPVLFTALNFRTPNLLKWDMGDGMVLTSGSKSSQVMEVRLAYAYAAAGSYEVKVYDDNGNLSLPPLTFKVPVAAYPRSLQVKPEKPLSMSIQVAADPSLIKTEPEKTTIILNKTNPARHIPRVATVKLDGNKLVESSPTPSPVKKNLLIKIGPYAGFFQPRDADLKTIYGKGDVIYGGRLGVHLWQGFYFWFSASQFKVIAKTTFSEDKTTLTLNPLSAFLRCGISLGFFKPYAGIGFMYMSFKEESSIGNITGNGRDIAYEGGFELKMNRHFFLDFGVRYEEIKVKPTGFEIDLGGLQAGVSLLVSF